MNSTTIIMSLNNITINNNHNNKSSTSDNNQQIQESFDLTWNDILYDGGLATWIPRSSFRWLTITVCLIGIIGKYINLNIFLN